MDDSNDFNQMNDLHNSNNYNNYNNLNNTGESDNAFDNNGYQNFDNAENNNNLNKRSDSFSTIQNRSVRNAPSVIEEIEDVKENNALKQAKKVFSIAGKVMTIIGFILFFIALIGIPISFMSGDSAFWLFSFSFVGIIFVIIGGFLSTKSKISSFDSFESNKNINIDYCRICNHPLKNNTTFCNKCGTPIISDVKCSCGTANKSDDLYCGGCGIKLNNNNLKF